MNLLDLAKKLHSLGHAPEFPVANEQFMAWVLADLGAELITRYQEFHHLAETGEASAEVIAHAALPRCGHPDRMADNAESKWAQDSISYLQEIAYPGVDPAEIAADYAEAIRRMAAVCGIKINPTTDPNAAQILAVTATIDGEWNVLALTELPPPDAVAGTVLHQTFDVAEVGLTKDQRIAMMAHEAGHFLGLGHALPGTGALMEPVLSEIGSPRAWDTEQLQQRYGARLSNRPPKPPPAAPAPATQAGPVASSVTVSIPQPGSFTYTFGFETAGTYLILIVPLK